MTRGCLGAAGIGGSRPSTWVLHLGPGSVGSTWSAFARRLGSLPQSLRVAASSDRVNLDEMSTLLNTEPLHFEVIDLREPARVRVKLRGELDLATAGLVADHLRRLCERRDAVVLDLDDLTFIDAAGMRAILGAAEHAAGDGWAFTVTRGSSAVRRLFELLDVDRLLPLEAEAS